MRIGHFPQHVNEHMEANLNAEATLKVRSAGHTEMDPGGTDFIGMMRRILAPAKIATAKPSDPGKHSREVPIAYRENKFNTVTDHYVVMLSADLGKGIWNDRHMTVVKWRKGILRKHKWAHIATHLNAAIQDRVSGEMKSNLAVEVTENAVHDIEVEIERLVKNGYEVVVTADWNWRDHGNGTTWFYSPISVAQRNNMHIYSNGLDHVLWTKGLHLRGTVKVFPKQTSFNKSDHPWLILDLRFGRA